MYGRWLNERSPWWLMSSSPELHQSPRLAAFQAARVYRPEEHLSPKRQTATIGVWLQVLPLARLWTPDWQWSFEVDWISKYSQIPHAWLDVQQERWCRTSCSRWWAVGQWWSKGRWQQSSSLWKSNLSTASKCKFSHSVPGGRRREATNTQCV